MGSRNAASRQITLNICYMYYGNCISVSPRIRPGRAKPGPIGLKYDPYGPAPPALAGPGRILGSVSSVTGQTRQFTRAAMSVFCVRA